MTPEKEDKTILDAGYIAAINDAIEFVKETQDKYVLIDRLERLKWNHRVEHYEGKIMKFYEKGDDVGYLIKDDIFGIAGIMIFIKEKIYMGLPESECVFAKNNFTKVFEKAFTNKGEIEKFYVSEIQKYEPNKECT